MKMTVLDRIFLLLTVLLAAYQVAVGINGAEALPMVVYTIAFGVLLVAGLLLIIFGFDVLDSPIVVIVSTVIPLCLSLGLVWEHLIACRVFYLAFTIIGFLAIVLTRLLPMKTKLPVLILAIVHGIAGLIIFLLPIIWSLIDPRTTHSFAFVGLGGALIGLGGLLLSFLKAGRPILPRPTIFRLLPGLFLLMTASFVAGFAI
jgi:hypothetical protein